MGQISCIFIDTNKKLKLPEMVIVNYEGVILGVGKGTTTENGKEDTDYLHCYVDNEKEKERNLSKAYEYLSCLSFENRAIVVSIDGGGSGCDKYDLQRFKQRTHFLYWGRSIIPNAGELNISCIPKINDKNQAIALSLYREAMNARSNLYKFLCLWKIIELKYNEKGYKEKRNNRIIKYRDDIVSQDAIKRWAMNKNNLWDHLEKDYRNAIAHITRPPYLITDDPSHLFKIMCAALFLDQIIHKYIEEEYDLKEKRCLVLMPGENIPRYATIEERLQKKDKYDEELFSNYMKNAHKPHHNFSDEEYINI